MKDSVALDLTVPCVVSDGGMVSMVSAIQALYYRVELWDGDQDVWSSTRIEL